MVYCTTQGRTDRQMCKNVQETQEIAKWCKDTLDQALIILFDTYIRGLI